MTASITAKEVVILGLNGVNKTYDGMISVSLGGTPSLLGVETADQANVVLGGSPTASLVSANAGFGVGMVVSGYTLSGSEAGNYQLVQPVGLAADIQPKPATITAKNQTKTVGTVINLGPGQREFSATGLVEGELTTKQVMVDSSGVINGKVNAETVEVRGEITQGLSVTDHLTVYATGKITGTIEYSQISVEKGAHLTGDLKVISKPSY
ncbi:MAG: polymer-forming cytoskeletal protein [Burkholderiaceae bacterium]|nr:polymer-forming cytoskeletal protein [Burkholderiaceae bacterium]